VKIRGKWVYLYRVVDSSGQIVDFRLSGKRDVGAAKAFFRKVMKTQDPAPQTITLGLWCNLSNSVANPDSRSVCGVVFH
jgi:transposase-like protein